MRYYGVSVGIIRKLNSLIIASLINKTPRVKKEHSKMSESEERIITMSDERIIE